MVVSGLLPVLYFCWCDGGNIGFFMLIFSFTFLYSLPRVFLFLCCIFSVMLIITRISMYIVVFSWCS
jgi:hypothetical protein